MPRDDVVEIEGLVADVLPGSMFRVVASGGHEVLATLSAQARRGRLRPTKGERVTVHVSPYDLSRGRVVDVTDEPGIVS